MVQLGGDLLVQQLPQVVRIAVPEIVAVGTEHVQGHTVGVVPSRGVLNPVVGIRRRDVDPQVVEHFEAEIAPGDQRLLLVVREHALIVVERPRNEVLEPIAPPTH